MSKSKERSAQISPAEVKNVIHELQVHQAELEMQNEQLRQAQIEASEARKKYADLYDFAPVGYFTFDKRGCITETNVTGASLLESEKRSLIGQPFRRFITPAHFSIFQSHLQMALEIQSNQTCRLKLTLKDGRLFDALIDTIAVMDGYGNFVHYRSSITDITEITIAEEKLRSAQDDLELRIEERTQELRASEERYRSVIDNICIGIAVIRKDGKVLSLNKQMEEWFPKADVLNKQMCFEIFHDPPEKAACSKCPAYHTLQDGLFHEAVIALPAGNDVRRYKIASTPFRDRDGNLASAIVMLDDITENIRFQELLKESEDRYRTIFQTTSTSTIIVEGDGTISFVNRIFEEWSGCSKFEVEGKKKWTEFVAEDDLERLKEYRRLRKINPHAIPKSYECRFIDKGRDVRHMLATVDMIPGTTSVVASLLDITEMKRAEELLLKQKADLEAKATHLEELNTTLKILLQQREMDKRDLEENVLASVKKLIMPQIEKLKSGSAREKNKYALIVESSLKDMISPFANKLSSTHIDLTPKEVQVAFLIRDGFATRKIAKSLNISQGTVKFHRENIRSKLDLKNKKANLKSYLLTLS
ncbi:MAG TPA: PAS domain S-box protein [Syntrophales bacterium]|nr:PAS domain S-box protein [Syntrophales bacterium]